MQQGLGMERALGSRLGLSSRLLLMAELYCQRGQTALAWETLAAAEADVSQRQELYFEPMVSFLRGTFYALEKNTAGAEQCWLQAIRNARRQGAGLWELKATTALCRLWLEQGKAAAARPLLGEVLHFFENEDGAPGLAEARMLQAAL